MSIEQSRSAIERIQVRALTKRFGYSRALAGVDVEFQHGTLSTLLGANGAGKSTLLGVLSTLIRPNKGSVEYLSGGKSLGRRSDLRRHLGVLAHQSFIYGGLNALENLGFWAKLYDLQLGQDDLERALDDVGLDRKAWERPASTYSRGMTQRLALARCMLHQPSVLLLDEPFTGLDSQGTEQLKSALRKQKEQGKLIVVVTHNMEAIAQLTDRTLVMERGKITYDQAVSAISYKELSDIYKAHSSQSS